MTDSLQNIASTYTMKQCHFEFEQIRDYCIALNEKLTTIDKINNRIHKERQGIINHKYHYYFFSINSIKYYIYMFRLFVRITPITSNFYFMGNF